MFFWCEYDFYFVDKLYTNNQYNMKNYLTKDEITQKLNISLTTLNKLIRNKRIPYVRVGEKLYRFDYDEVVEYLKNRKI